jgi:glutamate--cysteine ligase
MRDRGESFFQFAARMSRLHQDYYLDTYPPNERRITELSTAAHVSLEEQARIERMDSLDFDTYLARYLAD